MAVDWNFYGSARVATFWSDTDLGDGSLANGDDDDEGLAWDLQGNSRLGANVKAEAVRGQFEVALREQGDGSGDQTVNTRRIYGTWNFGPATLKVGKDYTPVKQFISGQAYDGDLGLLGYGTAYGARVGQLALSFGGFEVALINPNDGDTKTILGGEVDNTIPKIEAAFGMGFDMFSFKINGGYQTYEIDGTNDDVDVDSYTVGLDVGLNFGPGYVKGAINYGENTGDGGWHIGGLAGTQGGFSTVNLAGDNVSDVETLMFALVAGWKFTDMVSLEAGFGWREDSPDGTDALGNDLKDDDFMAFYVQAPLRLAPGVTVIPEFGYYDYGDAATDQDLVTAGNQNDEGEQWYLGAKWQIDF
jgi:hypothetical protein